MEDKQRICDLLVPALQATSNLSDITALVYDPKTEMVSVHFNSGYVKGANVAMDSGTSMIRDIISQIV